MKNLYQPPVNATIIACLFLTFMFVSPAHTQFVQHGEHHFPGPHPDSVVKLNHNISQMIHEPGELLVRFQDELEPGNPNCVVNFDSNISLDDTWGAINAEDYFKVSFNVTNSDLNIYVGLDSDGGDYFAGGSGTEADPYLIETAYHLDNIRYFTGEENTNKFFKQIADIDLGVAPWNVEEGWLPIGHSQDEAYFMGNYNGNGYKIHNLTINRPNEFNIGLFGYVVDAEILNLTLVNVDIQGGSTVGSIAGRSHYLTITGSKSSGTITGFGNWVGGLTGTLFNSNISKSFSSVNVLGYGFSIGGLSGTNEYNSIIDNSYFAGSVTGLRNVGGITGWISNSSVLTSYSSGLVVSTSGTRVGGLIGYGSGDSDASTSYWNNETSAQANSFGGTPKTTSQMLQQNTFSNWNFDDVWNINSGNTYPYLQWQEEVYDFNYPPDFVPPSNLTAGLAETGVYLSWDAPSMGDPTAYNIYRDNDLIDNVSGQTNYNDADVEYNNTYSYHIKAVYGANQSQQSNTVSIYYFEGFEGGDGTEENPYLIANAEQLNAVRYTLTSHFKQIADIDLGVAPWNQGEGWIPIGDLLNRFSGAYNGDGNTIFNLTINRPEETLVGLFSLPQFATIQNLNIKNASITGLARVGVVSGDIYSSTIKNINITGAVVAEQFLAGAVAGLISDNCYLENIYSNVDVSGFSSIGGIAGGLQVNNSILLNSYSAGTVNASNNIVGGLIGWLAATGNIVESYSTSDVNGNAEVGGLAGRFSNSYIQNSYATGNVTGQSQIGGLIGAYLQGASISGEIINNYSTGEVLGETYIGGFIGWFPDDDDSEFEFHNNYWDINSSGLDYSAAGEGLTTGQMLQLNSFVDWDFAEIWSNIEGVTYPYLQWQGEPGVHNYPMADHHVTFMVDMSMAGNFDPDNDNIYFTGSMFDWAEPGSDFENQQFSRVNDSMIWTKTILLQTGSYHYKYFINEGWEGGEWDGEPNRVVEIFEETVVEDIFGVLDPTTVKNLVSDAEIKLYPNPANNNFNISADSKIKSITIADIAGKVVYSNLVNSTHVSFSANNFENGLYLVRIITDRGVVVRKLLIQR